IRGITTIYDMMANGITYEITIDGAAKTLTRTELMIYARDPEAAKRAAAYESMLKVFVANRDVLAQLYKYTAGDGHQESVKLRGMASPIAARNLANDIPDDVVEALLEVCRENAATYQRFFRLKARWIGMKRLRRCDIYAPLDPIVRTYSYADAVRLVRQLFDGFEPKLTGLVDRVFDAGHVDSEPRPGKDIGAFCYGVVPDKTPWVLVNYNGRVENVGTLAHELGHAVHAMLASGHSVFTAHSSLPLAETASNFAQMLLLHVLLDSDRDPALRRYLLAKYVDDSYSSILRQAFFVLFEREAHRLVGGGSPTADDIAACYFQNLRERASKCPRNSAGSGCRSRTSTTFRSTATPTRSGISSSLPCTSSTNSRERRSFRSTSGCSSAADRGRRSRSSTRPDSMSGRSHSGRAVSTSLPG
ncbi:MAG: M3 family metallopeptidase, partial [Candidatus Bipolaricaulota bacterium]|nr:M3 family metallopeptidase [Candidatus Bipolaricaulota bacterium]